MAYRTLRVVLFKQGTTLRTALREGADAREVPLKPELNFSGAAYIVAPRAAQPRWRGFIEQGADEPIPDLLNRANGSVVLIEARHNDVVRVLGYTFGNGRTLLALEEIESDFGLRVVVNSVDPERLRRVETKVFEDLVLHTARQASRHSPTVTFSIDDSRDLVRAVAGEPRDRTLARRIAGSDSLAMSSDAEFAGLGDLSGRLLERYDSGDFREYFGFIEQVRPVRDPEVIRALDATVEDFLTHGPLDAQKVYLAPPEVIDFDIVDGFYYTSERRNRDEPHPDLDLAEFLATVGREDATIEQLKRHRIRAVDAGGEAVDVWTAYSCLIFETRLQDRLFMLSESQWFEVQPDFAAAVDADVARIARIELGWPDALAAESEREYNARVVTADLTLGAFDRVPIRIPRQRTPIEACDVLADHRLVHVKRRTSSGTLSHLFAQGRISGEAFRWVPEVREQMRDHLGPGHPLTGSIPVDEPPQGQFAVVFAVVAGNAAALPGELPFFSKLNLARTARDISRMGYRAEFTAIYQG